MKITLPTKLNAVAKTRAAERGCKSVDAYVKMLIDADAPEPISPQLEAELLKSIASPSRRVTSDFWAKKRRGLQATRRAKARDISRHLGVE